MKNTETILILGAGEAGRMILQEYQRRGMADAVMGFLDDDPKKTGISIDGKEVMGRTFLVKDLIHSHRISRIIIAMPSADSAVIHRLVEEIIAADSNISLHIVPSAERYFDSVPLIPSLEETPLADLLGREEYQIDVDKITESFSGKTVLVTGAGGSIGSEICRQLLKFGVRKIAALGRGEHSIYKLIRSLEDYTSYMTEKPELSFHVANVTDAEMMERIFRKVKPDIVFHAAAHKHVPLMEFNEAEALKNNVGGTRIILQTALDSKIEKFILISTDKTVRPTSVMGTSKRIAEMLTESYGDRGLSTAVVRFGNVIGSRGSVIPLFKDQIAKGGPVTVTDPDVTRYFMSIPEASLLGINAAALSKGGEVFVLDMGEQYRVADVAKKLIELHGLVPGEDIEIQYTGLRPGEKKYEELFYDSSNIVLTNNKKIMIQKSRLSKEESRLLEDFMANDMQKITSFSSSEIRSILKRLIPEYTWNIENDKKQDSSRLAT